jgi:ribosome-associated protein
MADPDDPTPPTPPVTTPETETRSDPTDAAGSPTDVRRRRARREHVMQDDVPFHAVARSDPGRAARALENARACARVADDNRGKDILLLDLRQATSLVDYFVLVTATSRRLSNAVAEEVDKAMKQRGERKLGIEGSEEGRWVLIDYGDFVVHIFSPEARAYYALEEIWGDADRVEWQDPGEARPAAAAL